MPEVRIRYARLPDRITEFRQALVTRSGDCIVTLMEHTPLPAPVLAGDRVILEPGAPVVWFTFDGAWHDIGRFHTADGSFTGWYANILTPVEFSSSLDWSTTDLCLDVFLHTDGDIALLDEADLERALQAGWVDASLAARVRREADHLMTAARRGDWPPPVVSRWTLEAARSAVQGTPGGAGV